MEEEFEIPEGMEGFEVQSTVEGLAKMAVILSGHNCPNCAIIDLARAIGLVFESAGEAMKLSKEEIVAGVKSILDDEMKPVVRAHVH